MSAKLVKIGATALVIMLALTGLFYATLQEDVQYYKHVDEVTAEPAAWHGKRLKLHGYVDSIERRRNTLEYRFKVQNNGQVVQASYTGVVPDNFKNGTEVVLDGTLSPAGFHVERDGIMAKCPSKYEEAKGAAVKTSGS
jgi:cytochrome c-type biogenesis protein CcmE